MGVVLLTCGLVLAAVSLGWLSLALYGLFLASACSAIEGLS